MYSLLHSVSAAIQGESCPRKGILFEIGLETALQRSVSIHQVFYADIGLLSDTGNML